MDNKLLIEKAVKNETSELLKDKNLAILENRLKREVNIFDILRIADAEIRHSNILAWLLDPNQNHGLGDLFTREFFRQVTKKNPDRGFNFHELNIYRERSHIDLLVEYNHNGKKIVICLENKIHASESNGQLNRYKDFVDKAYPDSEGWEKYFVFLTLDGHDASRKEEWRSLSYEFIIESLKYLIKEHEFELNIRSETIIKQYLTILERQVYGMDKETEQLLTKLNKKYPNAVRALVDRFSDDNLTNATSGAVKECLARNAGDFPYLKVNEAKTTRSLVRCQTALMDKLFPRAERGGGWGDGYKYFYEISCYKDGKIKIKLVFSLKAFEEDSRGRDLIEKIREIGTTRSQKEITEDREWVTAHVVLNSTRYLKGETSVDGDNPTDIIPSAEEKLLSTLKNILPAFEEKCAKLS